MSSYRRGTRSCVPNIQHRTTLDRWGPASNVSFERCVLVCLIAYFAFRPLVPHNVHNSALRLDISDILRLHVVRRFARHSNESAPSTRARFLLCSTAPDVSAPHGRYLNLGYSSASSKIEHLLQLAEICGEAPTPPPLRHGRTSQPCKARVGPAPKNITFQNLPTGCCGIRTLSPHSVLP
jgi:hypothetical protein